MKLVSKQSIETAESTPFSLSYAIDHALTQLTKQLKADMRENPNAFTYTLTITATEPGEDD